MEEPKRTKFFISDILQPDSNNEDAGTQCRDLWRTESKSVSAVTVAENRMHLPGNYSVNYHYVNGSNGEYRF